jgi:hypothetical protein
LVPDSFVVNDGNERDPIAVMEIARNPISAPVIVAASSSTALRRRFTSIQFTLPCSRTGSDRHGFLRIDRRSAI